MARLFPADTVQLATRIPRTLHVQMRVNAIDSGVTLSDWVADALTTHLKQCTGKKRSRSATKTAAGATGTAA